MLADYARVRGAVDGRDAYDLARLWQDVRRVWLSASDTGAIEFVPEAAAAARTPVPTRTVEIATILALREVLGPDVPLRIDPNAVWSVATAIDVGQRLHRMLEYLEDPTAGIDGMAAVRRGLLAAGIETPLAANVAVTDFGNLPAVVREDAVQVVLGDHHFTGGRVRVPDGPGLGGEIDRDALTHGRERYELLAYHERDDAAEMRRHVDSAWERRVPAW